MDPPRGTPASDPEARRSGRGADLEAPGGGRIQTTRHRKEVRMRNKSLARRAAALLAVLLPLGAAACGSRTQAAAVATAGAAAATAATLTDQNAEGEVLAPIAEADRRARAVLSALGLQVSKSATENSGTEIEHEARSGDRVVHVKLEAPAGAT